jgi:hypothetical protein
MDVGHRNFTLHPRSTMNTPATAPTTHLKEGGLHTALSLGSSGALEVVRIIKPLPVQNGDLLFAGASTRDGGKARSIQVSFTTDGQVHAPKFDASNGRIHLFYPDRDHPEVQGLLNSKRNRFCYFWRSSQGDRTHAWLLSSQ